MNNDQAATHFEPACSMRAAETVNTDQKPSGVDGAAPVADDEPTAEGVRARKLLAWLVSRYPGEVVTMRQVCRFGSYACRRADVVRKAMADLAAHSFVTALPNTRLHGHMHREAWAVMAASAPVYTGEIQGPG